MFIIKKIKAFVHFLGYWTAKIFTAIAMPFTYYTFLAATAICMKLFAKPLLPRYTDEEKKSMDTFWLDAPTVSKDLEKMKRQF